jgi:transcriptional regulator with XRE-family HTH domain
MQGFRSRPASIGDERALRLRRRFGDELRVARLSAGLTQSAVAGMARTSQAHVSRAERGVGDISLRERCRLAAAVGHELGWNLYPVAAVRLRDSGQLELARAIATAASSTWTVRLEEPVGDGRDARAADVLLMGAQELVHIEIERALVDLQAQLRAWHLKRRALAERSDRPVRFVLAVPDTVRNRRHLASVDDLLRRTLPLRSRTVWAAIRAGQPLGGDGVLVLRTPPASRTLPASPDPPG